MKASSNFRLPCGNQSFGVGCCACAVSSKYPESDHAPRTYGTRLNYRAISATCEVGTVSHPGSHALKDFRPPSECAQRLTQRFTQRFLQIIFGTCARIFRCGFLGVLSASAFFRSTRLFVPSSRNRHSSSGFFAHCGSWLIEGFRLNCHPAQCAPPS